MHHRSPGFLTSLLVTTLLGCKEPTARPEPSAAKPVATAIGGTSGSAGTAAGKASAAATASAAGAAAGSAAGAAAGGAAAAGLVCCASGKGMDIMAAQDCHSELGDMILLTSQCLDDKLGTSPTDAELAAEGARVCCDADDATPGYTTAASCAGEGGKVIDAARCDDIEWGVLPLGELDEQRLAAYQQETRSIAVRWFEAVAGKRAPGKIAEGNVELLMSSDAPACAAWRGDREYDQTERPNTQAFDDEGSSCLPQVKVPGLGSGRWQDGWRCRRHGLAAGVGKQAFDRLRAEAVEHAVNSGGAMRCFEATDADGRAVSVFFEFSGDASKIRVGVFDRASS